MNESPAGNRPGRPDELELGFLISDAARLMRERFNDTARSFGLTLAQARALLHLAREQGISQTVLSKHLEIQPITLLRQLDRLADAGLIERRPDPNDRRAQQLYLTGAGERLLEDIARLGRELADEAFAGLDAASLDATRAGLARIKDNLSPDPASSATDEGRRRRR